MANSIFTTITAQTVQGARDRALAALDELTNGRAGAAIDIVSEYVELNSILEEHKQKEEMLEAASARG